MATQSDLYGSLTAFTLTGASLASFAARQGTVVVNSTNLAVDYGISGVVTSGATAGNGNAHVLIGGFDGTTYDYPLTGTDAAVTIGGLATASLEGLVTGMPVPGTSLRYLAKIPVGGVAAGTAVSMPNTYASQAFNGSIPIGGIGLVLVNCTGVALSATASVFSYVTLKYTIA
jgi:hypothetical protein